MTISWHEFRCWLRHLLPATSAFARLRAAEAAEAAKPEDQRPVGSKSDALPIDELNEWLGWNDEEVVSGGG
ncbi:hypothetical protein [Nocardia farcinica]|uniref:hypothetical protein n=1 Tax=Nocardia farcinica TaxID=37329 RepID=UPI001894686F|nr:hypothetical protein [Nocardia farcinica]MBF6189422.1 hypothetical protein [Nocardia farcinica]MBF6291800.1 hypothetical protein [Nocardia farcinica]